MRKFYLLLVLVVLLSASAVVQARAVPGAFNLLSPALNATLTSNRPTFQWSPASGATEYRLRIKNNAGTVVSDTLWTSAQANCGSGTCSLLSPYTFGTGTFSWHIAARNTSGSSKRGYQTFKIQIPLTGTAAEQMLTLINRKRCAAGLKPLALENRLMTAAQSHSTRMAQLNFFNHTDPNNNSTFVTRVNAAGYPWTTLAENIAAGNATVQATFDQWWNSTGHRNNIMKTNIREMGLGYGAGGTYGHYWTLDLATRSGATGGTCPP